MDPVAHKRNLLLLLGACAFEISHAIDVQIEKQLEK